MLFIHPWLCYSIDFLERNKVKIPLETPRCLNPPLLAFMVLFWGGLIKRVSLNFFVCMHVVKNCFETWNALVVFPLFSAMIFRTGKVKSALIFQRYLASQHSLLREFWSGQKIVTAINWTGLPIIQQCKNTATYYFVSQTLCKVFLACQSL